MDSPGLESTVDGRIAQFQLQQRPPFPVWICYLWRRYSFTSLPGLLNTTWDCLMRAIHSEERKSGLGEKKKKKKKHHRVNFQHPSTNAQQPSTGILPLQQHLPYSPCLFPPKLHHVQAQEVRKTHNIHPAHVIRWNIALCIWRQSMGRHIM